MKKIVILSTDTLHHKYFIKEVEEAGFNILHYIFETTSVKFNFKTGPTFETIQKKYESNLFFKNNSYKLNYKKIKSIKNINSNISFSFLKKIKPDLGLVFGTRKIHKNIISLFKDGLVNAHRGDPEEYRGLDTDLWAMYHGEYKQIFSTIHFIESRLDTGRIIYKKNLKLDKNFRAYKVQGLSTIITTNLFIKFLSDYLNNNVRAKKQKKIGRYYSKMPIDLKKIAIKKFDKYCRDL